MVEHTQRQLRTRDQKEQTLKLYDSRRRVIQMDMEKNETEFKKRLNTYTKWKTDNKIEGILY